MATGITRRHSKRCSSRAGGRCSCNAGWEAWVYLPREEEDPQDVYPRGRGEELAGRRAGGRQPGGLRAPKPTTVEQAWEACTRARSRGRSATVPATPTSRPRCAPTRERCGARCCPSSGRVRLADLQRPDLQDLADRLLARGLSPSSVQTTLLPLRAIYRRALARGEVAVNPCTGLRLPAVRGRRERFASPAEAEALIAAAPDARPRDVGDGDVRRAAAAASCGRCGSTTSTSRRRDPRRARLGPGRGRDRARSHTPAGARSRSPPSCATTWPSTWHGSSAPATELIFGEHAAEPVHARTWSSGEPTRRGPRPGSSGSRPHDCRHTFASLMIAAGVNAKALSTFMGHANDHDHPRPLRPPDARLRGGGRRAARRLPRRPARARRGGRPGGWRGAGWRTNWRTTGARELRTACLCGF